MKLYNLITEATACTQWSDKTFVNGDGKTKPKITIEKTETKVTGTYEGPEFGFCIQSAEGNKGDSVHQLAGITVFHECGPYLKELYKAGTYVRPNLKGVTLERKNNYYEISIPLEKTTEDKAITSINQRGSMGGGEGKIDTTEFNSAKTRPMFYTETLKSTGISDMTEYFFCWRNLQDYPIKTSSNKEVVKKAEEPKKEEPKKEVVKKAEEPKKEEPKKEVVKKAEETKKEEPKNTGPELVVGGYFIKSEKGVIRGMKVFSSSPGRAIVMLYDEDGKPLFKQNETAWIYDQEKAREWGGDNILVKGGDLEKRDYWFRIIKF
jgi:hypothetical protein